MSNHINKMYIPKNILVTGGCGFIGSNFINYYLETYENINIINIDRMDYCASADNIKVDNQNIHRYKLIVGDLNNKDFMIYILNENNIDTIVHFAAQSHVDNSFGNSLQFTHDNVLGTHTLLECCRVYGKIQRFIHISTDEVYGEVDIDHEGCSEKNLLNPTNPYAATKASAEFIVRSYYHSFKLPIIITRGNNVYGPNQYPEKLIPKFTMQLYKNQKCTIHGKGETRRNFIHALDVAKAVDVIIRLGVINNIYNIGTNNEYSVMDITKKLVKLIKNSENVDDYIEYVEDRHFNDFRYAINSNNLRELGWSESIEFEKGLEDCVNWYINKWKSSNTLDF